MKDKNLLKNKSIHLFAKDLQNKLMKEECTGRIPSHEELAKISDEWLPDNLTFCRAQTKCENICKLHRRCESSYWKHHNKQVAELMSNFASLINQDKELFYATGFLHDIDYLKYPHDFEFYSLTDAHPFKAVTYLNNLDINYFIPLAILEHSPHLNLEPTNLLSKALLACDDIVTFTSASVKLTWDLNLPSPWIRLFKNLPKGDLQDSSVNIDRFYLRVLPTLKNIYCSL